MNNHQEAAENHATMVLTVFKTILYSAMCGTIHALFLVHVGLHLLYLPAQDGSY